LLTLSKIYKMTGQYEKALQSHEEYADLNQMLFSEESIRSIAQLKNQRRIQQQQAENELSQQIIARQQIITIFSISGFFLFVVLAGIISGICRATAAFAKDRQTKRRDREGQKRY